MYYNGIFYLLVYDIVTTENNMITQTAPIVTLAFSHPLNPNWIEKFSASSFMGAIGKHIESLENQGSCEMWDNRKELCEGVLFT